MDPEQAIYSTKTYPENPPVLLIGGGALLVPSKLIGANEVLRRPLSGIVNTISAAIARLSIVIDTVQTIDPKMEQQWLEVIIETVIDKTALES